MRLVVLALLLALTGCGKLPVRLGAGPNPAANVQAGAENVQGVHRDSRLVASRVTGPVRQESAARQVRAERIERVVTNEAPPWLVLALVVAVVLDSPVRWPGQVARLVVTRPQPIDLGSTWSRARRRQRAGAG